MPWTWRQRQPDEPNSRAYRAFENFADVPRFQSVAHDVANARPAGEITQTRAYAGTFEERWTFFPREPAGLKRTHRLVASSHSFVGVGTSAME